MLPLPGELPSTGNKSIMRPKVCISKSYRSSSEQLSFLSPSLSFFSSLSRPHYFISRDCVKWKRKSLAVQSPFFPVSIISSFHRASYLSLSLSPSITFLARETTPVVHINVYLINPHLAPSCPLPRRSHLRSDTIVSLLNYVHPLSRYFVLGTQASQRFTTSKIIFICEINSYCYFNSSWEIVVDSCGRIRGEFFEQVLIKEIVNDIRGKNSICVFMANRAIFTGTDATFSFDAATRPDCPRLFATTKSPRALIPSNKRIISVASARITGRDESSLLIPSFFVVPFFLLSSFLSRIPLPLLLSFFPLNQSTAIKWRSSAEIKGRNSRVERGTGVRWENCILT